MPNGARGSAGFIPKHSQLGTATDAKAAAGLLTYISAPAGLIPSGDTPDSNEVLH